MKADTGVYAQAEAVSLKSGFLGIIETYSDYLIYKGTILRKIEYSSQQENQLGKEPLREN